jgi:hypothetical protein
MVVEIWGGCALRHTLRRWTQKYLRARNHSKEVMREGKVIPLSPHVN